MIRTTLIAVGKAKPGPEQQLFEQFRKRLAVPMTVKEISDRSGRSIAERRRLEGEKLLAAVPKGAKTVALDERGRDLGSRDFAELIGKWRDAGSAEIAFLIGGADGLDRQVRGQVDLILSLGAKTWPHMLVRGMVAEQVFRAQCILNNHPYHRD